MLSIEPTPWMKQAECSGAPEHYFFPGSGGTYDKGKAICAGCPVRQECLEFAIETPCEDGLYGGLTYKERQALVRERKTEVAA